MTTTTSPAGRRSPFVRIHAQDGEGKQVIIEVRRRRQPLFATFAGEETPAVSAIEPDRGDG